MTRCGQAGEGSSTVGMGRTGAVQRACAGSVEGIRGGGRIIIIWSGHGWQRARLDVMSFIVNRSR